jgi:hypothetical protein
VDNGIVDALRWPAQPWVLLGALLVAVRDQDERDVPRPVEDGLAALTTVLVLVVDCASDVARVDQVVLEEVRAAAPLDGLPLDLASGSRKRALEG